MRAGHPTSSSASGNTSADDTCGSACAAGHVSQVPPQKHMKSIRTQSHIRHQPSLLPSSASCNSPVAPTGLPGPCRAYCCDRSRNFRETCRTHPSHRPLQGASLRQVNCRNSSSYNARTYRKTTSGIGANYPLLGGTKNISVFFGKTDKNVFFVKSTLSEHYGLQT